MQTTSNSGVDVQQQYQAYYDKKLISRLLPNLVYSDPAFGEERPLPKNNTKYIMINKYESLAPVSTISEGQNPAPVTITNTPIQAYVREFGSFSEVSSLLQLTEYDPVITRYAEVFGEQAANSLDQYDRDQMVAGSHYIRIQATGTLSSSGAQNTVAYPITKLALDKAILGLEKYNVSKFTSIISGSTGVGTSPVPDSYICIVHPDVKYDIMALGESNGIIPAYKYSNVNKLYRGEFAAYQGGIRFLSTTNGKKWAGAGAAGTTTYYNNGTNFDVYGCLVFGKGFKGQTYIDSDAARIIIKPASVIGGALERFSTVGWVAIHHALILNDYCGVRIECAATIV